MFQKSVYAGQLGRFQNLLHVMVPWYAELRNGGATPDTTPSVAVPTGRFDQVEVVTCIGGGVEDLVSDFAGSTFLRHTLRCWSQRSRKCQVGRNALPSSHVRQSLSCHTGCK